MKKRKRSQLRNLINQENLPLTIETPSLFEGFKSKNQKQFKPPKKLKNYPRTFKNSGKMEIESPKEDKNRRTKRQPFKSIKNTLITQKQKQQKLKHLNHANLQKRLKNFIQVQESQYLKTRGPKTQNPTKEERIEKFDKEHRGDPQEIAVYAEEIYDFLKEDETKKIPKHGYFEKIQNDINPKMRSVLLD